MLAINQPTNQRRVWLGSSRSLAYMAAIGGPGQYTALEPQATSAVLWQSYGAETHTNKKGV
jgi:hypothetical protein